MFMGRRLRRCFGWRHCHGRISHLQSSQAKDGHQLQLLPALQTKIPDLLKRQDKYDEVQGEAGGQGSIEHGLQINTAPVQCPNDFRPECVDNGVALENVGRAHCESPGGAGGYQAGGDDTERSDIEDAPVEQQDREANEGDGTHVEDHGGEQHLETISRRIFPRTRQQLPNLEEYNHLVTGEICFGQAGFAFSNHWGTNIRTDWADLFDVLAHSQKPPVTIMM